MENNEYNASHFSGSHGADAPNGLLYWKMIEDIKELQSTVAKWPFGENTTPRESNAQLSCSAVIETLDKIEAVVAHLATKEEKNRYLACFQDWNERKDEFEAIEGNLDRAGRHVLQAKAMLATDQNALWALLCLLYVLREKYVLRLFRGLVDSGVAIPLAIRKCFAQLGLPDDESIRTAVGQT